jgi:drug/metabolite transporter (DMT)-like permease
MAANIDGAKAKTADFPANHPTSSLWRAYLALGMGMASVSFSAIFVRWADAPGTVAGFYRVAVAVLLMAWPFFRRVRARGPLPWRGIGIALLGGLFFAADLGFWATGVMMTGATIPTVLANTAPLWVGLGAVLFFKERLSSRFWAGLALAIPGAALILGLDALRSASPGLGSLFGLLSGLFFGSYLLITQKGRKSLGPLTYLWPAALSSALTLLLVSLAFGHSLTDYPPSTFLVFLAMGTINQVLGYLGINYALGQLPASVVAPSLLGQPVGTAVLAALLLGERLSGWQILGGASVLAGVYVVYHSRRKVGRAVMTAPGA